MASYLLIARFTNDDIPLSEGSNKFWAEKKARDLLADPSLLETKWKNAMRIWPAPPGKFVGVLVLQLDVMGDPVCVTFASSRDPFEAQQPQPAETPIPLPDGYVEITDPNHQLRPYVDLYLSKTLQEWMLITEADAVLISDWSGPSRFCCLADLYPDLQPMAGPEAPTDHLPDGCIEITDPNHRLRPHVDFYRRRNWSPGEWMPITETDAVLISDWSEPGYRFCCPADKHPDLQGKPAEIPTREQLQAVVRSLEQSNSDLRAEFEQWRAHADTRIGELMTENSNLQTQLREQSQSAIRRNESDQQTFEFLQAQNSDLRRLNEDLNNRLSKTLARAALATHLESKVRASGIQLLRFSVAMGDRRRWATTFVEEGVLAKLYLQAIERIDEQFTELFGEFVARFPHIQPDMPDEWQMRFDADENDSDAAANDA